MLVAENPNLVSKIVIGQSYEDRPLNVLKVNLLLKKNWMNIMAMNACSLKRTNTLLLQQVPLNLLAFRNGWIIIVGYLPYNIKRLEVAVDVFWQYININGIELNWIEWLAGCMDGWTDLMLSFPMF